MLQYPGGLDQSLSRQRWAEWIELNLLFSDAGMMSRTDMQEGLQGYFPDDEDEVDAIVEEAFRAVEIRQRLLDNNYPLRHELTHIIRVRPVEEALSFSFLLALSAERFYDETRLEGSGWHEPALLFEYVVTAALARYLDGRALRIGKPRENPAR